MTKWQLYVGLLSLCTGSVLLTFVLLCVMKLKSQKSINISFDPPRGDTGPSSGALVIVEPRDHPMLARVIDEFSARVPKEWVLYVVHGSSNRAYAERASSNTAKNRRTVFIELHADNLSAAQYNALFKTPSFWDCVHAEHILIFQTDAMPCGVSDLDIARFGTFGYIGCAYDGDKVGLHTGYWGSNAFYGVGGLSLRRKSFIQECLKKYPKGTDPEAEDVTFSACVNAVPGYDIPTAEDLGDFCAQGSWGDTSREPRSWGVHKFGDGGMSASNKSQFTTYCPVSLLTS